MSGCLPLHDGSEVERVGPREYAILTQGRKRFGIFFVLRHGRSGNADRLAARRLIARGLLRGPYSIRTGPYYHYQLTERGRECWLLVKGEAK